MFLADSSTPWSVIADLSSIICTVLVAIMAVSLYFTVRNFHQGKLKIKGGYIVNQKDDGSFSPLVRVSFFNAGKYDVNLYSAGFIINKKKIECIEKMLEGNLRFVPCLSRDYCDFKLTADDFIELLAKCKVNLNDKVKISFYALDTAGKLVVVKAKNLVELLRNYQSGETQVTAPDNNQPSVDEEKEVHKVNPEEEKVKEEIPEEEKE